MDNNLENKKKRNFRISWLAVIGLIIGAAGGYIYYWQIGCVSGSCGITSNPWMSTAWGSAFGYLVFDLFSRKKPENRQS